MPARSSAVTWTNASFWPSSGWMKPKPLVELKNFTVPLVIGHSFDQCSTEANPPTDARISARAACPRRPRRSHDLEITNPIGVCRPFQKARDDCETYGRL